MKQSGRAVGLHQQRMTACAAGWSREGRGTMTHSSSVMRPMGYVQCHAAACQRHKNYSLPCRSQGQTHRVTPFCCEESPDVCINCRKCRGEPTPLVLAINTTHAFSSLLRFTLMLTEHNTARHVMLFIGKHQARLYLLNTDTTQHSRV